MERNSRTVDSIINDMNFDDCSFNGGNAEGRSTPNNYRNMRFVPLSKWGIRYENENGNLSVSDFIETVDRKARLYKRNCLIISVIC